MAGLLILTAALAAAAPSAAPAPQELADLRDQIARERTRLDEQQRALDAQRTRLEELERTMVAKLGSGPETQSAAVTPGGVPLPPSPPAPAPGSAEAGAPSRARSAAIQPVGQAPTDQRQVQVAVLAEQGGVITRAGRLTLEGDLEYARADRNRVVFRGIEIPQSVLIGVFDINESRQDVLTMAGVARLGVTNRLEVNARVPYVYRSDRSVLAPVSDPAMPNAGQIDKPVSDGGLGDVDFGVRYQFTNGTGGRPYLIAGVQGIAPTGTNPFAVNRDALGNATEAATGAGFWGVSPSLTAILPTDPAVLFGTLGYTINFGRSINRTIGPAFIEYVKPGNEPAASLGIALSLNPRTSLSFGYAHTWAFGTRTRLRLSDAQTGELGELQRTKTRDLQLGRFLFGVSYRTSLKTTINWNVEVGATDDATDLRTTLRIPLSLNLF
ncbi:transporter [Sphingomonas profundi]|uniref:transporter n=1 Tax=Alterirhizorhabdus profundi TaxID=2681549 RepID=UPI0012E7FD3A|nr:transporter [Sphingomonas profundi]